MTKNESQKQRNKEIIYSALRLQKHSKKSILSVMQSMGESIETPSVDADSPEKIRDFFENLKKTLDLCNENINTLEKLTKEIDNIDVWNKSEIYNGTQTSDIVVPVQLVETSIAPQETQNNQNNNQCQDGNNESSIEYKENTLVISETKGKVILPYELSTLRQELNNSSKEYSSIDDVIRKNYLLPISQYKNPFIARFREAYKLMRHKENSTIKEAFDLGLELMFNYNLHPAIISACRNIDELDIYLDYLDSGETNKFKFFKIIFEVAPTVVKAKHEL